MKKYVALGVMVALFAGVALANVITVPFFFDDETAAKQLGLKTFIGLKNTTTSDIHLSLYYRDGQNKNRTPGPAPDGADGEFPGANTPGYNTFVLYASSQVSFSPLRKSPDEGVQSRVPDMIGFRDLLPGAPDQTALVVAPPTGAVELRWIQVDGLDDVVGRVIQLTGNAASPGSQSAYTIPRAVAKP